MVEPVTHLVIDIIQFSAAAVTALMLVRIAYVLSANPIGEFAAELIYLRSRDLRIVAWLLFLVALAEMGQAVLPFLTRQGWLGAMDDIHVWTDVAQAVVVLIAFTYAAAIVGRYTHRALDRRIRESMETLAYLEGQRRRRRNVESGRWTDADDE